MMSYMKYLQIETTTLCNGACVFCVHPTLKREKTVMDPDLFEKIVAQIPELPDIGNLYLHGVGEPLLDHRIASGERFRVARKYYGGPVVLYTNGSRVTFEWADKIFQEGLLNGIIISLNATTRAERLAAMGFDDYDQVVSMARRLSAAHPGKVDVRGIASTNLLEDAAVYIKQWGMGGHLFHEMNWGGEHGRPRGTPRTHACHRTQEHMKILVDGRVSLCCADGEGDVILGDLNQQTIKEVWDGQLATKYREYHNTGRIGELKLCARCTSV
jgi:molybdenum cofactor biosynthesis enzyme MoaA